MPEKTLRTLTPGAAVSGTDLLLSRQGVNTEDTSVTADQVADFVALGLNKADVGLGNVDNTSDANKPVSTAQQTALDLKLDSADFFSAHGITIDGGGIVITVGSKGYFTFPFACTITNWYMAADAVGALVIDVKRNGASIVGAGNKPELDTEQFANAAATGWTSVAIASGDIIEYYVDSATTVTRNALTLKVLQV